MIGIEWGCLCPSLYWIWIDFLFKITKVKRSYFISLLSLIVGYPIAHLWGIWTLFRYPCSKGYWFFPQLSSMQFPPLGSAFYCSPPPVITTVYFLLGCYSFVFIAMFLQPNGNFPKFLFLLHPFTTCFFKLCFLPHNI